MQYYIIYETQMILRENTDPYIITCKSMDTAQTMKFSIKDFSSKCDQTRSFLRIWSHLLEKSLMENFIFCAVFWVILSKLLPNVFTSGK